MSDVGRLDWQKALFRTPLKRFDLSRIMPDLLPTDGRIRVSRNHGFEQVASALPPFLAYAGLRLAVEIGDYDDSLSFVTGDYAVELVWLDFDRYDRLAPEELASWLVERLAYLRANTRASIVVANAPGGSDHGRRVNEVLSEWASRTAGVAILELQAIAAALGQQAFDDRRAALTGTRLSDTACLECARTLGFKVLPALLSAPIKAVALDLDNTLYAGVLGEDGPAGVELGDGHRELQETLVRLAGAGVLLTIVSRNEREDVDALFATRTDFPLQPGFIADWQVSWGPKAEAVRNAAAALRIATDAFLMVDDNLGELSAVGAELPTTRLLFAGFSPEETTHALRQFPALWPSSISRTDSLRANDLRANLEREKLSQTLDPAEHLRSLAVTLTFEIDPAHERPRLRDISAKTNQFNLALARLSELDIAGYLDGEDRHVVHVMLSDRLADSGSVAAVYGRKDGRCLVVDELCISCRAMGRSLEGLIVTEAIRRMASSLGTDEVTFPYAIGPRNEPARRWLEAYADRPLDLDERSVVLPWTEESASRYIGATPVRLAWTDNDH